MRVQSLLFLFIVLIINNGCKKPEPDKHNLKAELQKIVDAQQAISANQFPGKTIGFGLYAKSAGSSGHGQSQQDVYVSSGLSVAYGKHIHFRGASTTKTFTAAAILTLAKKNKLNLDDFITDNIPGTDRPYVPATNVYAVPYKNKITIRLLLQHRAGVFDVTNLNIPETVNAPYAGLISVHLQWQQILLENLCEF